MNTLSPDQIRAYTTILRADPNYEMRKRAAQALVQSNDPVSIDVLASLAVVGDDEQLQEIARDALLQIMGDEDLTVYLDEYRKANEIGEDEADDVDVEQDDIEGSGLPPIPQTGSGGPKDVGCLPWAVIILCLLLVLILMT
jgi:hypothetical protein